MESPVDIPPGIFHALTPDQDSRLIETETERHPDAGYWRERASARPTERRESHYREWLENKEFDDTPERRSLWFRRYKRPEPPLVLELLTLREINATAPEYAPRAYAGYSYEQNRGA